MKDNFNYNDYRIGQRQIDRESSNVSVVSAFVSLLACVVLLLIVFSIFHNGDTLTFQSFLEFISSQSASFDTAHYVDYSITSDWFAFNFLRDFLNIFIVIFNLAVYLCKVAYVVLKFFISLIQFFVG